MKVAADATKRIHRLHRCIFVGIRQYPSPIKNFLTLSSPWIKQIIYTPLNHVI